MKIRAPSGKRRPGKRHDADGESDVRGDRDAPALAPGPPWLIDREDERGHHHPAQRGESRQGRGTGAAKLAEQELAFDLQPGEQEEERHRGVVHPAPEREVEVEELPNVSRGVFQSCS